jgi:hypothetical protein
MPIIRSSRVLYKWLPLLVLGALVYRLLVWCGAVGYVSGVRDVRCAGCPVCGLLQQQKFRRAFQTCYYFNFYNFVKLLLHDLNLRKPGCACTFNLFGCYFGEWSLSKIVSKQTVFVSSYQTFINSVVTITFSWSIFRTCKLCT